MFCVCWVKGKDIWPWVKALHSRNIFRFDITSEALVSILALGVRWVVKNITFTMFYT